MYFYSASERSWTIQTTIIKSALIIIDFFANINSLYIVLLISVFSHQHFSSFFASTFFSICLMDCGMCACACTCHHRVPSLRYLILFYVHILRRRVCALPKQSIQNNESESETVAAPASNSNHNNNNNINNNNNNNNMWKALF